MKIAVTTTIPTAKGGNVWFFAEVDEFDNLDDLFESLNSKHSLICDKLHVRQDQEGRRRVYDREATILGIFGIVTITPAHVDILDEEE